MRSLLDMHVGKSEKISISIEGGCQKGWPVRSGF